MSNYLAGTTIQVSKFGNATVLPDFDFETYSSAGYIWDSISNKWGGLPGEIKKGISIVGVVRYAQDHSTEVLCAAYNLKDGNGARHWKPGDPNPQDLFNYINSGGLLEAWNCSFEWWIWNYVCVPKYNWPFLYLHQMRDAMAKSRAFGLPGALDDAGKVLNSKIKKDPMGKRLLTKFSIPRNPTKTDSRLRIHPGDDFIDSKLLYKYNLQDIEAEAEISNSIPDLSVDELNFWLADRYINTRGVQMDLNSINSCIEIIEQAYAKYNKELQTLTDGFVNSSTEVPKIKTWCGSKGRVFNSLNADIIEEVLKDPSLPFTIKRVLEIRKIAGSAAVKKLYSMRNQISNVGRLHDLFIFHSARTGRSAGAASQPQNLPNHGPIVAVCTSCKKHFISKINCPWCGKTEKISTVEWNENAVNDALQIINTRDLNCVEYYFKDAVSTVSGCLRGLFISKPGYDLICSDYQAIEAVVLAAIAGEEWRLEVFRTHGKIYEMSASKITGVPFSEFEKYKKETGSHHPLRKQIGKVAELASGYRGWVNAWLQFGALEHLTEEQIKEAILAWRAASPKIVELWGGQKKFGRDVLYGLEGMAIAAIQQPEKEFKVNQYISYECHKDILYCKLPSGRFIIYHRPRLEKSKFNDGIAITFESWNTNPANGARGWQRLYTHGGKLTENVVQAVSRDILTYAIVNLEKNKYPIVLHVHDEIVSEIPENFGSIQEFEKIMSTLPIWASTWPIKASGGWRGKRYRK